MPVERPGFEGPYVKQRKRLPPPRKAGLFTYLLLILLVSAIFSPLLLSEMLWSEHDQVQRSGFGKMEHWTEAWQIRYIRQNDPVSTTSFFIEQALPFPPAATHRAINLLLHLAAAILLLRLLQNLKLAGAIAATFVFALHPIVIQTLFWPGYREEIIGLVALLAALYFGTRKEGSANYLFTVLLTGIASLIHTAALAIPLLLALCTLYEERHFRMKDFNRALPLLCICLFIGVWTAAAPQAASMEEIGANDKIHYLGQNIFFSMQQSLAPSELALFYPAKEPAEYGATGGSSLLPFLLFVPFFILAAVNIRRTWSRAVFLGLIAYLLLALPGAFTPGQFLDGSIAHEAHYFYIALPALMAFIVAGSAGLARRLETGARPLWFIAVSLLLCIEVTLSISFATSLGQPAKMWDSMRQQWPESWIPKAAYVEYALASDEVELKADELILLLEEILQAEPDQIELRTRLARSYRAVKHTNNAIREYKRLLREHEPEDAFLQESIEFFESIGMRWEADNVRKRLQERTAENLSTQNKEPQPRQHHE